MGLISFKSNPLKMGEFFILFWIFFWFKAVTSSPTFADSSHNELTPMEAHHSPIFFSDFAIPITEELRLDVVEENFDLRLKAKPEKWISVNTGQKLHLFAFGRSGASLTTIYRTDESEFQGHEDPRAVEKETTCAVMFQNRVSQSAATVGVYVISASPSPLNTISWHIIQHISLKTIWEWPRLNRVIDLKHFSVGGGHDRLLVVEVSENNELRAYLYGFYFMKNLPRVWLLDSFPLGEDSVSLEICKVSDHRVFLLTLQKNNGKFQIYQYQSTRPNLGTFELKSVQNGVNAQKMLVFPAYPLGRSNYVVLYGNQSSSLLRLNHEGKFTLVNSFVNIQDFIVVTMDTIHQEAIIFGKTFAGDVVMFSKHFDGTWAERVPPKCRKVDGNDIEKVELSQCIGGDRSWDGATLFFISDLPSILFADRKSDGEIFNLVFTVEPVRYVGPSDAVWLDHLTKRIEGGINELKSVLRRAKSADSSIDLELMCGVIDPLNDFSRLVTATNLRVSQLECDNLKNNGNYSEWTEENETATDEEMSHHISQSNGVVSDERPSFDRIGSTVIEPYLAENNNLANVSSTNECNIIESYVILTICTVVAATVVARID